MLVSEFYQCPHRAHKPAVRACDHKGQCDEQKGCRNDNPWGRTEDECRERFVIRPFAPCSSPNTYHQQCPYQLAHLVKPLDCQGTHSYLVFHPSACYLLQGTVWTYVGAIVRLLAKERINEGRYQHDCRNDVARYLHAMGCETQQGRIRKASSAPESKYNDIQYQLTEMIPSVLDKKR